MLRSANCFNSGVMNPEKDAKSAVSVELERFHQPYSASISKLSKIVPKTGISMRLAEKMFGTITASVLGSLIFLAPASLLPDRLTGGNILVQPAHAQTSGPMARYLAKINAADDAYFKAAIAIETAGESAGRLASVKKADDSYFEAVIAFEMATARATQIAEIEAADDAHFKAAMALEAVNQQSRQLAELKAEENAAAPMMLAQQSDDTLITASIPANIDPVAKQLANIKAADDAYFDAVIALETSGENPEDLAKLKASDDAYFDAVIALDLATDQAAAAKKAGKVKMASAGGASMPAASAPAHMAKQAPLPAMRDKAKRKMARKRHRVQTAHVEKKTGNGPFGGLLKGVVNGVHLAPFHMLSNTSR